MQYVVKQVSSEKKNALLNVGEDFLNGEKGYPGSGAPGCPSDCTSYSSVSPQICPLEESLESTQLISYLTPLVAARHHRPQGKSQAFSDLA